MISKARGKGLMIRKNRIVLYLECSTHCRTLRCSCVHTTLVPFLFYITFAFKFYTIHYVCVQVEEEGEVVLDDEDEGGVVQVSGCVVLLQDLLTA